MITNMEEQKPAGFLEGVAPALMTFEGLQDVAGVKTKEACLGTVSCNKGCTQYSVVGGWCPQENWRARESLAYPDLLLHGGEVLGHQITLAGDFE